MDTAYPDTVKTNIDEIPEITLHNVSFQYGDRVILQDKNYSFHAGCKYAVMGENGSGKTTLTKIIFGLLPGYTGEIRYGQVEQKNICPEDLHRHIAYVDQQVYLFQDTIRFNITLGQSFTDREIMAVIKRCRLEDFVNSLPDGLDTVIKENGKNLLIYKIYSI